MALLDGKPALREGRIYFIRSGEFVKIGYAWDVYNRMKNIATNSPHEVELVACIAGTVREEEVLHKTFRRLRHRGEWFRYEGQLAELVEAIRHEHDPMVARAIADQWHIDAFGVSPEGLPSSDWHRFDRALQKSRAKVTSGNAVILALDELRQRVDLANRLHKLMLERGWNQARLAKAAGISRPRVSKAFSGKGWPDESVLAAMARALGLPATAEDRT